MEATLWWVEALDKVIQYHICDSCEGLGCFSKTSYKSRLFKGFQVNEKVACNLKQFVDDTILVGEVYWSNMLAIKSILRDFQMIYGLRINIWTSKIYGIGAREKFLQAASYFLS